MPVNKEIGNLWFKTQEEIDEYDDLMVSNIELKSENYDDPSFSILGLRKKRESVMKYSDEVIKERNKHGEMTLKNMFDPNLNSSTKSFWFKSYYKYMFGIVAGYFIMREIPMRNFYARSLIMSYFLYTCWKVYQPGFLNASRLTLAFQTNPDFQ